MNFKMLAKSLNVWLQLYIRSTDVNRTLISAMANLAGMYPTGIPGRDFPVYKEWPSHWTPIPVHTVANEDDFVIFIFSNEKLTISPTCVLQFRKKKNNY